MTLRKPRKGAEAGDLEALRALEGGPLDEAAMQRLQAALDHAGWRIVAEAAAIAQERRIHGLRGHLQRAFERFRGLPAKGDPGCVAKLALVEALDVLDHPHAEPFLDAVRIVQLEPVWGGSTDTAENVRGRGIRALANLGYADVVLVAGELLADPQATVRLAAAEALAHSGAREGAGLLRLALARQDLPEVRLACMSAMLDLAPDFALPYMRARLDEGGEEAGLAAAALGESGRDDALEALLAAFEAGVVATERAEIVRALALHRTDRALHQLGEIVAQGRTADAQAAISALAARRTDERVAKTLRGAVERRGETDIADAFGQIFHP